MVTEFQLTFEEFSAELEALTEMSTGQAEGVTARARIAAGNAATLLLAAVFEEYVRQQVRAAFKEKVARSSGLADFPKNLATKVWKRTLEVLMRAQINDLDGNSRQVEEKFAAAVAFSIKSKIESEVSDAVAHNENNMRPQQMGELFAQIGVSGILGKCCAEVEMADFVGADDSDDTRSKVVARVEDFFRRRNTVAHAITLGSSSGPAEIAGDIELFRILGHSIARTLEREFPSQELEERGA
jgi:hypothetical protein